MIGSITRKTKLAENKQYAVRTPRLGVLFELLREDDEPVVDRLAVVTLFRRCVAKSIRSA